ncbi:unnamed protein product [Blepharisma stoltei]|uniref:Tetratricopeptide repeat protein n=1 Tax=Blepharisma stoltei TaxID=1481888 RepID=A0AAU9K1C6_9CILI|nr:unnamed protein product [Blepharisma stoltei]
MEIEELILHRKQTSHSEDTELIETIEETAFSLLDKGNWKKALELTEKATHINGPVKGQNDPKTEEFVSTMLKKICGIAIERIEKNDAASALTLLERLETITLKFHSSQLTADKCEIFNNIACAYRKINKLHTAKRYLEKALLLTMNDHEDRIDKSTTYLNMCAVLSNLHKHSQAIRYARQAMQFAQEELLNAKLDEKQEVMNHKIAVLGIAYNNLGVEEEFLGNKQNAIEWYRKAVNFMMKNSNAQQEHLLENFRQCYEEAVKKGEGKKTVKLKRPMSAIINKQSQLSISSKSNSSKVNSRPNGNKRKYESTPMSPSLEGGFNTRYPLEGKPITFDDIRVKTRKIASAKQKMHYKLYAGSEASRDSDTEEDIKDLDDLGLLSDLEESEKIDKTSNKRVAWSAAKDRPPIHPNINSKPIFSIRSIASARRQPKNLSSTDKKSSTSKLLPLEIMETPNKGTEIVSQPIFHFIDYNDPKTLIIPKKKEEIKVEPEPKIEEIPETPKSKPQTPEIITIIKEEKIVEKPMPEIKLTKNEEKKPSKNLIEKIDKNVTKKKNEIDMSKALPFIIKLQARVRAMQAREKFKLMKNKPNVVYRAVKFINQQEFKIIVSKMGSKTYVTAYNGENTYKMETNSDIDPKDVLNLLNFDSKKGLNLKPVSVEEDKKILVRTRIINLAGEECEVKYFTDPDVDTLQIKLRKLSNNRIYTYFIKNLALHSQSLLIQQINEVIQPNLAIIDQYLTVLGAENLIANPKVLESPHVVQKPEPKPIISAYHGRESNRKDSASSSNEPNLEESSKNTSQISSSSNNQSIERATAGLSIKIIESKGPAVPIEPENQNSSSLEINPAQKLKFILESNKSQIKSMKNPFQTETVKNVPKLSKVPEEVKPPKPASTTENPKSKRYTQKEIRAVIVIQKVFRGHRIRDKLKFENPKHSLLAQIKKRLGKNKYTISIYKLSDGVLIDVQNVGGNERYWKAIRNPKEYVNNFNRFSDIRLLMNRLVDIEGKIAILRAHTSKSQIRMQDCSFFGEGTQQDTFISPRDTSNWPAYLRKTINGKEYAIQADINKQRGLDISFIPLFSEGKTISKTFSEVDIIEELGVNEPKQLIDLLTLRNGKIEIKRKEFSQASSPSKLSSLSAETGKYPLLYQTCRFYDSKNYQIKIILVPKNPGRLSNDDVLFVNIKSVASKESVAKLPIEASKACALTGLSLRSLDLAAVNISKHIIYDNGKFSIDFSARQRDPIQSLITIQALVRGFLTRRLLKKQNLSSIRSPKNASSKLKNLDLSSLSVDSEDSETEKENSFVRNFGGKNWYWRASRPISNEECIITIYESKDKMGIEAVVCSTSKRLILTVEKSVVNDIDQFVSHLELSPDKKRLLHSLEKAAKVIYSDTRFISNKLGNLEIYVTEKGYFASFFLIKEGKSLTLFLGENVSPDESVRKLRIEDKTGQDILVISS